MRSVLAALAAAALFILTYPPFGWGILVVPGLALFLWLVRTVPRPGLIALVFGLAFYSGLIWWIGKLGFIAVAPLVAVFGGWLSLYGWLLGKCRAWSPGRWWLASVGGWAAMEAARVRFPVGGFEWGLVGYSIAPYSWARAAAQWVGTTGWSVVLVAVAAGLAVTLERHRLSAELWVPSLG
ncbi:MAG: hypothetical protein ACRDWH_09435, partial [Acidimicrobiia bacterium]